MQKIYVVTNEDYIVILIDKQIVVIGGNYFLH
jgi:hypothetical protein